jgi:predicted dehydrogenase
MTHYRVAIIGTGGIARLHAQYYLAHPATEIVAVADISPAALDSFCAEHPVPARYGDYRELLAVEKPDLVSVCTWQGTHSEITIAAAEAGAKGAISEKPMGEDLAGADAMIAACEARGVPLAVHHQTRSRPSCAAARQAIAEGRIGEPLVVVGRTGGGLLNCGSHVIDIARYALGDPACTWVIGQAERTTNRHERGCQIEDLCVAVAGTEGGARIMLESDLPEGGKGPNPVAIGTDGMIVIGYGGQSIISAKGEPWAPLAEEPQPSFLEEFIAWVEGGPEHRSSARQARATQEVMMGLYESAKTRRLVPLPLAKRTSPLLEMIEDGTLPAPDGPRYDIRKEEALKYCFPEG